LCRLVRSAKALDGAESVGFRRVRCRLWSWRTSSVTRSSLSPRRHCPPTVPTVRRPASLLFVACQCQTQPSTDAPIQLRFKSSASASALALAVSHRIVHTHSTAGRVLADRLARPAPTRPARLGRARAGLLVCYRRVIYIAEPSCSAALQRPLHSCLHSCLHAQLLQTNNCANN
jgi:hypothetical protein